VLKEKIWANLHRIIELFHKKIVKKLLNYGLGIRKKPIPGPVSRGQKGTGSWIPDPDPQYCFQLPASLPPYTNAVKESIYPVQARPFRVRKKNKKYRY
jgi:hypothetical protein